MASKLRSLKRNIAKLEKMGFILPSYVKQIRKEQTAGKYSQKELMKLSKFKEIYQGKERIVSGERGRELILRERARKASETRRRRKTFDFGRNKREPIQYFTRTAQADMLDVRLRQYFDQFQTPKLGRLFLNIYENEMSKYENRNDFLYMLLDKESDVISEVQKAVGITPSDVQAQDQAYAEWLLLLTNDNPTQEQKQQLADAEDEQWQVVSDESPWG